MKYLFLAIVLLSCTSSKMIPNYKFTPQGFVPYRYSKPGEPRRDILSTGDTLVTFKDTLYIVHPVKPHDAIDLSIPWWHPTEKPQSCIPPTLMRRQHNTMQMFVWEWEDYQRHRAGLYDTTIILSY